MLEYILNIDKELFLYLNNLGSPAWDDFWLVVTNKFTFIPLYALLLFLIFRKMGLKPMLLLIVIIVIMITFTDQITNLFKYGFERPRPCQEDDLKELMRYIAERCGRYGFFSGHSSNSMAAAVFAGLLLRPYYRNLIFILLFWSAVVAYSRIYVGVHFPLDIFFGMLFGAISGYLFFLIQKWARNRFISN
ncbi:MAG: phosphatase PAP2 family protein [Bacteroidia bacterium]|nr:phosphatase PAP2 family protein [Bacteroidia bacterium]MBT8269690.1 phosphatase PAP2 family protein [Bacteroidia bacterium]NNK69064.1 phosphatase PAP2 family protein [Flavobacteriaceae bacterium]NNL80514.1 phosphatase PAP2 family protein [Flavobacteriaceae bacterium]